MIYAIDFFNNRIKQSFIFASKPRKVQDTGRQNINKMQDMKATDKNTKEAAANLAQAQRQQAAKANAEYWFGRVHYAGLDVYLRLYGHEIGRYLNSNNYAQHLAGLFDYICKEKELTQAEAEQVFAALRFILLGIF